MDERKLKEMGKVSKEKVILIFLVASMVFGCGLLVGESMLGFDPEEERDLREETEKLNLNTADYYELIELPGIGDAGAKKIIDFRLANGGCNSLEEMVVLGLISSKTAEKLVDDVVVEIP